MCLHCVFMFKLVCVLNDKNMPEAKMTLVCCCVVTHKGMIKRPIGRVVEEMCGVCVCVCVCVCVVCVCSSIPVSSNLREV